ncbi:hypothetical protein [Halostagnicola larsenii]|uniref:hypothetical protein n=1 Tax=Halostagnicola larsenii TaxID=353800 RepID=UPI0012F8C76B|nr:hypothetical protein [Halostagnicola larsenii]
MAPTDAVTDAAESATDTAQGELGRLLDFGMWFEVILVFAGYLLPFFVKSTLEGRDIITLPNEVYGLAMIFGSGYVLSGSHRHSVGLGSGVYIAENVVSNRLEITDTLAGN